VKGLFGGDIVQNALESTGLNEHVEGFLGEGTAVAESLGVDADQAVETLGGVGEVLPDGLGEVVQGATEGTLPDTPV
jgi:Ethanolamine utilization protein EutJ (predicted chaperonin)